MDSLPLSQWEVGLPQWILYKMEWILVEIFISHSFPLVCCLLHAHTSDWAIVGFIFLSFYFKYLKVLSHYGFTPYNLFPWIFESSCIEPGFFSHWSRSVRSDRRNQSSWWRQGKKMGCNGWFVCFWYRSRSAREWQRWCHMFSLYRILPQRSKRRFRQQSTNRSTVLLYGV